MVSSQQIGKLESEWGSPKHSVLIVKNFCVSLLLLQCSQTSEASRSPGGFLKTKIAKSYPKFLI